MKIAAVTTCHTAGWEQYGRRMSASWRRYWPVPLRVYAEGFAVDGNYLSVDLPTAAPWLAEFKAKHPYKARGRYDYRFDAARFAHKVAAICAAADAAPAEYLIWVDADTVTHQAVPPEFVDSLLPGPGEALSWLDREGKYPECGFVVFHLPSCVELLARFKAAYTTGALFNLPEWHDSFVLEQLVHLMDLPAKSLSGEAGRKTSHPFVNGPLGAYMDHLKGPRKAQGRSSGRDLKVTRTEPYWSKT